MITREYGQSIAAQVGNAHEKHPEADLSKREFNTRISADETIDLLNNKIARSMVTQGENISNPDLAIRILEKFKTDGLWTIVKQEDGKYTIDLTKLTNEEYNAAIKIMKTCDENGYTPQQLIDLQNK